MPTLWSPEYSVDDADTDRQHRHIMDMITAVEVAGASGDGDSTVDLVLSHLTRFVEEHFACEERCMEQHGYSSLDEHRREHKSGLVIITRVTQAIQRGECSLEQAGAILHGWLHHHLVESDQKYAATLRM